MSRLPCRWSDRSATTSATAGSRRSRTTRPGSTASYRPTSWSRRRLCGTHSPPSTRPCARGLEESIARLRATCEAELAHDVVTELGPGARVTQRMVPVQRVGLYVPGGLAPLVSSVVMNVVPAQVAGVASIALTSSPQQGQRRAPASDDPGGLRPAGRRGGVRRRRGPGDRHVRPRRRSVPARRPRDRSREHLHGRGQAVAQGHRRDRRRGRSDRDRRPRRRQRRPGVRRRRPDQPGRARPAGGQRAGHAVRGAGRRGRGPAGQADRGDPPRRPDPGVADRAAVRHRPRRRPRPGTRRGQCVRRRAPRDPDP